MTGPEAILAFNRRYGATVLGAYVGTARMLARHAQAVTAFARLLMFTMFGDARQDIAAMRAVLPEDTLICSSYSQNEHWRIASCFVDSAHRDEGPRVPVGYPPSDTDVALIVEDDDRAGDVTGELFVASPLLAMGSWPDPSSSHKDRLMGARFMENLADG